MPPGLVYNFPACPMHPLSIFEINFLQSSDTQTDRHEAGEKIANISKAMVEHCIVPESAESNLLGDILGSGIAQPNFSNGMKAEHFGTHGHWWAIFSSVCDRRSKLTLLVHRLYMLLCIVTLPFLSGVHPLGLYWIAQTAQHHSPRHFFFLVLALFPRGHQPQAQMDWP